MHALDLHFIEYFFTLKASPSRGNSAKAAVLRVRAISRTAREAREVNQEVFIMKTFLPPGKEVSTFSAQLC